MDPDTALAVLKITSVLITATLGVAGLLANYRDRYGKLTRAGVAVLSGMLISNRTTRNRRVRNRPPGPKRCCVNLRGRYFR